MGSTNEYSFYKRGGVATSLERFAGSSKRIDKLDKSSGQGQHRLEFSGLRVHLAEVLGKLQGLVDDRLTWRADIEGVETYRQPGVIAPGIETDGRYLEN